MLGWSPSGGGVRGRVGGRVGRAVGATGETVGTDASARQAPATDSCPAAASAGEVTNPARQRLPSASQPHRKDGAHASADACSCQMQWVEQWMSWQMSAVGATVGAAVGAEVVGGAVGEPVGPGVLGASVGELEPSTPK